MKKRSSILRIVLPALAGLALCHSAHALRALQKNPNTGALIEGFKSGANTIELSATGTLLFNSGFTLTGGSHLKTALSLNNVENTALSTWAGTSNLTTLGTVTTGAWQGSIIAPAYLGTGSSISTKFLRGDGTWQTVSGGGGLTIGTTTTSGASAGDILISDGTLLQKLTTGAGIATWLATPTLANLNSAVSDADLATTGANTFTGNQTIDGNVGIGGVTPTTRLQIRAATNGNTDGLIFQPQNQSTTTYFGWAGLSTTSSFTMSSSTDLNLLSGDANYVRLGGVGYRLLIDGSHNSIVIPSFVLGVGFDYDIAPPDKIGVRGAVGIWNNYTSATSNEGLHLGWASNVAHVWTVKGSGGGTARSLVLGTDATAQITLEPDGDVLIDYDQLPTSDPVIKGQLWRDGTTLKVSAGP